MEPDAPTPIMDELLEHARPRSISARRENAVLESTYMFDAATGSFDDRDWTQVEVTLRPVPPGK